MASPFEIGRSMGMNFAKANRELRDENSIQSILAEASKNPQDMQNAIGKILSQVSPERQQVAMAYLQSEAARVKQNQIMEKRKNFMRARGLPEDAAFLPDSSITQLLNPVDKTKQQNRLERDSIVKQFNTKIKETDAEIKNTRYDDKEKLKKKKKELQKRRDRLLDEIAQDYPVFDPSNSEHKQKAEDLFAIHGDKDKVRELLEQEFSFE